MYEARVDFKLLTRAHLCRPFLAWMKRPTQRFRLGPRDRIIELTYYWVGDRTSKPRSGGVDLPQSKPLKKLYHWSLREERAAARLKKVQELKDKQGKAKKQKTSPKPVKKRAKRGALKPLISVPKGLSESTLGSGRAQGASAPLQSIERDAH